MVNALDPKEIADGIKNGDRIALSRGITLIESSLPDHHDLALTLLDECFADRKSSFRLGITGVPGVGKSTFIDALGMHLLDEGHRVAVLAVDPTSNQSGGSILGDKTRMEKLVGKDEAFIRPSPARNSLGGVERTTAKSIILCEAAGYDMVLVETVGVGQSETTVSTMVDFFLLLMLPSAGDELQGIKRGIMELADGIFVNKAELNPKSALKSVRDYKAALHLMNPRTDGWSPFVSSGSALEKSSVVDLWNSVLEFKNDILTKERFDEHRMSQHSTWFRQMISDDLIRHFTGSAEFAQMAREMESNIYSKTTSPFRASDTLLRRLLGNF